MTSQPIPGFVPISRAGSPWNKGRQGAREEGPGCNTEMSTINLPPSFFLQGDLKSFTMISVPWGKGNVWPFQELLDTSSGLTLISEPSKHRWGFPVRGAHRVRDAKASRLRFDPAGFSGPWLYRVVISPALEHMVGIDVLSQKNGFESRAH